MVDKLGSFARMALPDKETDMTPAYQAGYFMGKRDGTDMVSPRRVAHEKADFRRGYSDGYHKGTGGLIL